MMGFRFDFLIAASAFVSVASGQEAQQFTEQFSSVIKKFTGAYGYQNEEGPDMTLETCAEIYMAYVNFAGGSGNARMDITCDQPTKGVVRMNVGPSGGQCGSYGVAQLDSNGGCDFFGGTSLAGKNQGPDTDDKLEWIPTSMTEEERNTLAGLSCDAHAAIHVPKELLNPKPDQKPVFHVVKMTHDLKINVNDNCKGGDFITASTVSCSTVNLLNTGDCVIFSPKDMAINGLMMDSPGKFSVGPVTYELYLSGAILARQGEVRKGFVDYTSAAEGTRSTTFLHGVKVDLTYKMPAGSCYTIGGRAAASFKVDGGDIEEGTDCLVRLDMDSCVPGDCGTIKFGTAVEDDTGVEASSARSHSLVTVVTFVLAFQGIFSRS